ncbi:hypothetical protein LR48_Vigan03g109600 [Vigna angularis]|uniref:Uncharacterized protein n=1 Tax=Phaseolus angularis TaxID=3914 RepID=A0A0L9U5K9_PHAAN|nr:hypothetical protein LR48_Vigan03g109600 [Vigna angularis]
MTSSSSSRRKWKVAQIARNANPIGWISDEDIRGKLFSLWKMKTVVSHRYLKLLIKEVWIGIVIFQPIRKEGFLFQIWIGHQGLIGFTMIKNDDHQQV